MPTDHEYLILLCINISHWDLFHDNHILLEEMYAKYRSKQRELVDEYPNQYTTFDYKWFTNCIHWRDLCSKWSILNIEWTPNYLQPSNQLKHKWILPWVTVGLVWSGERTISSFLVELDICSNDDEGRELAMSTNFNWNSMSNDEIR